MMRFIRWVAMLFNGGTKKRFQKTSIIIFKNET